MTQTAISPENEHRDLAELASDMIFVHLSPAGTGDFDIDHRLMAEALRKYFSSAQLRGWINANKPEWLEE
jgi:hypothetical protein